MNMQDFGKNMGVFASILTVIYIVPQIYKTRKTKDSSNISCETLYLSILQSSCWFIYAFIFGLNALMVTECIVISLNLYRTHLYYKFNKKLKPIFPFTLFQ
jgi:uncharacterized protein with PQ loop repeat